MATLDVLAALAELASTRRYARPQLDDEPVLHVADGRHPVLDQTLPPGTLVPNDLDLSPEGGRLWLITGPNMSGKSVFIRQVALINAARARRQASCRPARPGWGWPTACSPGSGPATS